MVRDEQERHAGALQPGDVIEELLDLAQLEPRGRLVEDDEAAALAKRAGDLEQLLLADRQLARALVDVDVETPDVELLAPQPPDFAPVDRCRSANAGWSFRKRFSPTVSSGMIVDF